MGDYIDLYIQDLKANHASELSITAYSRVITDYLSYCSGNSIPSGETVSVAMWKTSLGPDVKLQTVSTYLTYLSGYFRFCCETLKVIESNPVTRFIMPSAKKLRNERKPYGDKLLKENEIGELLGSSRPAGMKRKTALRNKAIIDTLMTTGIRNSELRALTPADLHFGDADTAHIIIRSGKGDKFRIVPFPDAAQTSVKTYMNSDEYPEGLSAEDVLFGVGDTAAEWHPMNRDNLSLMVKRYVSNATGHDGVRSHGLRHAFASELLTHDVTIQNIQSVLGHSSITTTERYAAMLHPQSSAVNANSLFNSITKEAIK